jgi:hypothetical protein
MSHNQFLLEFCALCNLSQSISACLPTLSIVLLGARELGMGPTTLGAAWRSALADLPLLVESL